MTRAKLARFEKHERTQLWWLRGPQQQANKLVRMGLDHTTQTTQVVHTGGRKWRTPALQGRSNDDTPLEVFALIYSCKNAQYPPNHK